MLPVWCARVRMVAVELWAAETNTQTQSAQCARVANLYSHNATSRCAQFVDFFLPTSIETSVGLLHIYGGWGTLYCVLFLRVYFGCQNRESSGSSEGRQHEWSEQCVPVAFHFSTRVLFGVAPGGGKLTSVLLPSLPPSEDFEVVFRLSIVKNAL